MPAQIPIVDKNAWFSMTDMNKGITITTCACMCVCVAGVGKLGGGCIEYLVLGGGCIEY